jgi:hypothetical protein
MFWIGSSVGNDEKLYETVACFCAHGNEDTFEYRNILNYIKAGAVWSNSEFLLIRGVWSPLAGRIFPRCCKKRMWDTKFRDASTRRSASAGSIQNVISVNIISTATSNEHILGRNLHRTFARLEVTMNCFTSSKNLHLYGSWSDPILPLGTECPDSWLPPLPTHLASIVFCRRGKKVAYSAFVYQRGVLIVLSNDEHRVHT